METAQNALYSWTYDDTKNRSPRWYMLALAISIGLIIWGFITGQYGMSILVMLIVGFVYFLENNSEDQVAVQITNLWIAVQDAFYDYPKVQSFSIVYDGPNPIFLRLKLKRRGIPVVNIRLDSSIASDVRPLLVQFLEESDKEEISFIEKITHFLQL